MPENEFPEFGACAGPVRNVDLESEVRFGKGFGKEGANCQGQRFIGIDGLVGGISGFLTEFSIFPGGQGSEQGQSRELCFLI